MEYSGAGKKLIHEKNQKQKISWHCPFTASNSATAFILFPIFEPWKFLFDKINFNRP